MIFAHVGGVPLEELLPWLGPGTGLVLARACMAIHLRRHGNRDR
jgi:hypothetical protein